MASEYFGLNRGSNNNPSEVVTGSSTGSTDVELRVDLTKNLTRNDVRNLVKTIIQFLESGLNTTMPM